MERNYSMMLKQMQMAYITVTMKEVEDSHDQCVYCWKTDCGCENKETVMDSLFLNFEETPVGNVQNNVAI